MSVAAEGLARHDRTIGARNANNDRVHEALVLRYYESAGAKQGILMDVQVPIFEYDTSQTIQAKLLETACDVLPKGIELIVQGGSCSESHPGKAASSALDETLKADHCSISSARPAKWLTAGRRLLRDVFYVLVLILHALKISGYRLFRRGTITILYYHRVSDVCQDGMTIGIHAFEKQIRFIKKHCQVWHADDLKTCLRQGGRVQGVRNVMITFDDGYEDNFTNALPILKRYDCPALFFISTGMIGTDNTFEHDRHLAPSLRFRNMTWPQVQEAQQSNIAIGVHSHTHADLGGVSHQTAVAEIEESISCFSRHLCQTPEWMSFPFGKIKNFNNELVTFVKQNTPIIGLFSANGHSNVGAIADYDIQRINIGYDDTGLTFIYKLSGGIQDLFRRSRPHPTEIVPAKRTRAGTVAQDLDSQSENHNRARAIDSRLRRG
jgi:peptidoglycan/xylan/chitin deacetylase (PgdA/CDA1 family)